MKKTITLAALALIGFAACNKPDASTPAESMTTTEGKVLNDFVDVVAVPQYNDLSAKSDVLNTAIIALNANATQANLDASRAAWLDMRKTWEQCEGFLFGPVENDNYDPNMDTWPTDYVQMDSLLGTNIPLTPQFIGNVTLSLRGFHPIEYIIFGDHGARTPADITARQKEYMVSLAADLQSNCHALAASWSAGGGDYGGIVKAPGATNSIYATRKELFVAMVLGLVSITHEVGISKMEEPLLPTPNPQKVESPYSGNSVSDFRNNITGLQNVYTGHYTTTGTSLSDLVAANNATLDNKIKTQIAAAISSFANITLPYEQAIFSQHTQIQATQAALATLETTLGTELKAYILQYVKD